MPIIAASRIGEGVTLHPHVVIGKQCVVGKDAILYPRVVLYDHCEVGARSILHSGVVLGSDGFGYALHQGRHEKLPHIGKVVVEEDVEIGANTAVDCGAMLAVIALYSLSVLAINGAVGADALANTAGTAITPRTTAATPAHTATALRP